MSIDRKTWKFINNITVISRQLEKLRFLKSFHTLCDFLLNQSTKQKESLLKKKKETIDRIPSETRETIPENSASCRGIISRLSDHRPELSTGKNPAGGAPSNGIPRWKIVDYKEERWQDALLSLFRARKDRTGTTFHFDGLEKRENWNTEDRRPRFPRRIDPLPGAVASIVTDPWN